MARKPIGTVEPDGLENRGADGTTIIDPVELAAATGNGDGNGDGSGGTGDGNGTGDSGGTDNSGPRKRGRKPGSTLGPKTAKKAHTPDLAGIEAILLSVHGMMAAAMKAPELSLSQHEAATLSKAAAEVASHYPIVADPKTLAWVNLAAAVGMIYGPRAVAIAVRVKRDNKEKSEQPNPYQYVQS